MANAKVKHKITGEVYVLPCEECDDNLFDILLCPCKEPVTVTVHTGQVTVMDPIETSPLSRFEELKFKGWRNLSKEERDEYQQLKLNQ